MPSPRQAQENTNKASPSQTSTSNDDDKNAPPRRQSASVHLEGFADAAPSPMAAAGAKPATGLQAASVTTDADRTPNKPSQPAAYESPLQKARKASSQLIQSALLSTLEASYAQLQHERDSLQTQLSDSLSAVGALKLENAAVKNEAELNAKSLEEGAKRWKEEMEKERAKREEMEHKLRWSEERVDRLEAEGESLRGEISRLTYTNEQHTNLLTQIQTQNSFSTSQVIPLKLELTRLQQELDAVTSHSNHIEEELASRNQALAEARHEHSKEMRLLRGEADERKYELERRDRELSSTRRHLELAQAELERMRHVLHEKECQFIEQREMMEQDLNKERELVSLKDQAMLLARDQRDAAAQQLKDIQAAAMEAAERERRMEQEMQSRLREEVEYAVRAVKEEEEAKRMEIAQKLREVEEAKNMIEEDILSKGTPLKRRTRLIEGGNAPLAITDWQVDGEDSRVDLYSRLAETEDELRAEQHDNKRLKLIINRIHQDVASKTPIFHQKQLELQSALEELDEAREMLDDARREVVDIRADNHDFELRNQQLERECRETKRENNDLALQVQRLLQRDLAQEGEYDSFTFDSVQTLQEQNQKLLRDHHIMSEKIQALEDHINNNPEKIELDQLKEEVITLREDREKQSNLVAGIVHQRDLYRALVVKNDARGDNEAGNELMLSGARTEQPSQLEVKNRELVEEAAKLRAALSSFQYEREALEGRLARLGAHSDELSTSNERLRGELIAANAMAARMESEVRHFKERCERFEASLHATKEEKETEASRRYRMEELSSKLQVHLDGARAELAKKQQQFDSASSKMKMLEVQLENAKASERRITAEANELRAEVARQGALLGTIQRIEASLVAKSDGERVHLEKEVQRLTDKMSIDEKKYTENILKLEGKVADLELHVKDLTAQKEAATANASELGAEVSQLKVEVQEMTLNLKSAEKELTVAKRKLGDVAIDSSVEEALEAKVATLTSELESTKSDLEMAKERVAVYQKIAKSSEDQLVEITAVSTKYKEETEADLERLKQSEKSQKEAVAELTKDLMDHRGEKEKAVNELNSKIESLSIQLISAKKDASDAIARMESLSVEMKSYQQDAINAQNNYERELALHAEARIALRDARSKAESEQRLRESAEASLVSVKSEFEAKESCWQVDKKKLEESIQQGKTRIDDLQRQNHLLHEQLTSLSETVEKFQADRTSQLVGDKDDSADKQLADLRELLQFKQSECVMLVAELASCKRATEREHTAAEMAKKSLEEARSELKLLRESSKDSDSTSADKELSVLHNKLKATDDQLVLLRESNTMLREETQRLTKKLSEVQTECKDLQTAASPNNEKLMSLEVEKASLEAEKTSLSREVDAWKNRVHSLVSKFNQIDPEEHAQALASIETLKAEALALKNQKDKAERDSTSAKGLVARLNKEVSTQKASIDAFKAALENTKAENEKLTKSVQSNEAINKKIAEAEAAAKKSEDSLKAKIAEHASEKSRVDHLKKICTNLKGQLKDAKEAEGKAKSNAVALQKQITVLNQKLAEAPHGAVAATVPKETSPPASTPEKAQTAVEPTQAEKVATTADEPVQTILVAVDSQSNPKGDGSAKTPGENTLEIASAKKKGKKRKGTPQKNTSAVGDKSAPTSKKSATTIEPTLADATIGNESSSPVPGSAHQTATSNSNNPPQEKEKAQKKDQTPSTAEESPQAQQSEERDAKESPSTANDAKQTPQQSKPLPTKKLTTLTKSIQAQKKELVLVGAREASSTAPPQSAATTAATNAEKKEEELKRKMLLLKKRKAEAQLKMQAASKKKLDAAPTATGSNSSGKSLNESDTSSSANNTTTVSNLNDQSSTKAAVSSPNPTTMKSSSKSTAAASSLKPLPPVPENNNLIAQQDVKHVVSVEEKKSLPGETRPAPVPVPGPGTFGSSTVTGFAVPSTFSPQAEPTCPKPSFESSSVPSTSVLESSAAMTLDAKAKMPEEKTESPDTSAMQPPSGGTSAFLNLTPPGKSEKPKQFVFGKSANITLPVPAPSPFSVFSQKAQTPFGSTFSIDPPFGSNMPEPTTLSSGTAPAGKSPESKQDTEEPDETVEEGEIDEKSVIADKDPVAKKA